MKHALTHYCKSINSRWLDQVTENKRIHLGHMLAAKI